MRRIWRYAATAHTPQQKHIVFPDDFPERLKRFKEESGLSWAEIARRLGTYLYTVRRWWKKGMLPSARHMMALLTLADSLGLGHLFTD